MKPHAPNGQRTLFEFGCTKRKRAEGEEAPRELRTRLNPELAARLEERHKQVAAAIAARPPPGPYSLSRNKPWGRQGGQGQGLRLKGECCCKGQRNRGREEKGQGKGQGQG